MRHEHHSYAYGSIKGDQYKVRLGYHDFMKSVIKGEIYTGVAWGWQIYDLYTVLDICWTVKTSSHQSDFNQQMSGVTGISSLLPTYILLVSYFKFPLQSMVTTICPPLKKKQKNIHFYSITNSCNSFKLLSCMSTFWSALTPDFVPSSTCIASFTISIFSAGELGACPVSYGTSNHSADLIVSQCPSEHV